MLDLDTVLLQLERKVTAEETKLEAAKARQKALEDEIADLTREDILLNKVEEALLQVSSRVLGSQTKTIDTLTTAGLRIVFEDLDLEFKAKTERYRGKTAVKFELLENGQSAPITDSYGGGVLTVVGVLLRATTIIALDLKRIILLDETMSHLATRYIPNASKLLKKLCTELGFTIIMVTHQPEFAVHATRHYEAKRRGGATAFEEADRDDEGRATTDSGPEQEGDAKD